MPINAKATYFWSSEYDEGWSESFYLQGTDLAACKTIADTILTQLLALRDPTQTMVWARVSDVAVKGDSLLLSGPTAFPCAGTYTPGAGAKNLEADSAIKLRLNATASIKNLIFLRGLTTDALTGRSYQPVTAFDTAFNNLLTQIVTTTPVYVRHRTSVGPPPTYSYTVINEAVVVGVTSRKPGRPFGIVRGRRTIP